MANQLIGDGSWPAGPEQPRGTEHEVHVWCADGAAPFNDLSRHLDESERKRAGRFVVATDAARFVAAHGLVRLVLARYLAVSPGVLEFSAEKGGKPCLVAPAGSERLRFNLSHSAELALLAVAWNREVGVDVERVRPGVSHERLARRFFSSREHAALRSLPEGNQREAFFASWTRKEACLKARGAGILGGLGGFDVPVGTDVNAAVVDEPGATARWALIDLPVRHGYRAALAVEGPAFQLQRWSFVPSSREI